MDQSQNVGVALPHWYSNTKLSFRCYGPITECGRGSSTPVQQHKIKFSLLWTNHRMWAWLFHTCATTQNEVLVLTMRPWLSKPHQYSNTKLSSRSYGPITECGRGSSTPVQQHKMKFSFLWTNHRMWAWLFHTGTTTQN